MNNTAEKMASESDVFIDKVNALRGQVSLLKRELKGDDLSKHLIESSLATIDSLIVDFSERLDAEADDYNSLVGSFEEYQESANKAMGVVAAIIDRDVTIDTFAQAIFDLKQAHSDMLDQAVVKIKQLKASNASQDAEFKQYQKSYPKTLSERLDRMEKENRTLRKDRRELKESLTGLNQKFNKQCNELKEKTRALSVSRTEVDRLNLACRQLDQELQVALGVGDSVEPFPMVCNGKDIVGYIHTFPYGLAAKSEMHNDILVAANIHYQIRTTYLVSMDVLPSIWGVPLYLRLPGFAEEWNRDIDESLSEKIMAYLETEFPRLHRRITDARVAPVDELKMRPETLAEIKKTAFDTVYSVACIPVEFHESIPFMLGENRQEIIDACRVWADRWDKENGGVEDLYAEPKVMSNRIVRKSK